MEPIIDCMHRESWLEFAQPLRRNLDLLPADVGSAEEDLAVNVGKGHHIVVYDRNFTHAGRRESLHDGAPKSAGADHEYVRVVQEGLLLETETRQVHLPGGACKFVVGEGCNHTRQRTPTR
ncbi:hypothetical protein GCM10009631_06700 [Corynebacterium glaucum]